MAGPGRQGGALAEELDLDPVADDVAVAQQADEPAGAEGAQQHAAGVGAERDDGEAHGLALGHEPVVELAGGSSGSATLVIGIALQGQPGAAPLPAARRGAAP